MVGRTIAQYKAIPRCFWLAGILCGVLLSAQPSAQSTRWDESISAGLRAYQQGRYAEAETVFVAALNEAEKAIQYLNAAVDHGWRARDWTEQEEKFEFLHDSPEWAAVLKRMSV